MRMITVTCVYHHLPWIRGDRTSFARVQIGYLMGGANLMGQLSCELVTALPIEKHQVQIFLLCR